MSEQNSSGFPFAEVPDGSFDINAIFGSADSAGTAGDVNPFEAALAQQAAAAAPTAQGQPQPVPEQPEPQPAVTVTAPHAAPAGPAPVQMAQPVNQPDPQPVPAPAPAAQVPAASAPAQLDMDPLTAAMAEQETKTEQKAAKSLFEKAPVFAYGSAKEEIKDTSMTFEELRIAKADDFPELGEGKRVSWTVEYGKTTKTITDPKGTTIASVKAEIERSTSFLDTLKKAKDKNPDCLVKPRVTAQSKGIASYKGVFTSLEEARESDKAICLFPSNDGKVYELRKTELGEFIAPKHNVVEFPKVRAGFTPALPRVPLEMFAQIVSFFRCYMSGTEEFEALAHILWDKQEEKFVVRVPEQSVTRAHIDADLSGEDLSGERYLHYIDIHSHNTMEARFSPVDDNDEQATRIYIVMGRLDKFFPDMTVRMSCGGAYVELDPGCVLESFGAVFPHEWQAKVKLIHERVPPVLHPITAELPGRSWRMR